MKHPDLNHRRIPHLGNRLAQALAIGVITASAMVVHAASLPASAEIYNISQGIAAVKTEQDAQVSLATAGTPGLIVQFPSDKKYPAVNFQSDDGLWDMSAYNAIEVVVVNTGSAPLNLGLRIDNPGNWKEKPWSSTSQKVAPGKTETIVAHFGYTNGKPSYPLDPAKITNVKLLAAKPKPGSELLITSIKAIKANQPIATETTGNSTNRLQLKGSTIFDPAATDIKTLKTSHTEVAIKDTDDAPSLQIDFGSDNAYPAVYFSAPASGWDLSDYAGVEIEITNPGQEPVGVGMRVDNQGPWKDKPWSSKYTRLKPGETKMLQVVFGMNNNNPGYPLDASRITKVQLFTMKPKAPVTILVKELKAFGTPQDIPTAAKTTTAPSSTSGQASTNRPRIQGDLIHLNNTTDLSALETFHSEAVLEEFNEEEYLLRINFKTDVVFPALHFPIPTGGWNLSDYAGVEAEITNPGQEPVGVGMRVDNEGPAKDQPWNSKYTRLKPGETKTLQVVFGMNGNNPGYPLDPTRISKIQLFTMKPKAPVTIQVKNLKAFGSAKAITGRTSGNAYSTIKDLSTPVTPEEWVGQRPPVNGDWVMTFEDNFDGDSLDETKWIKCDDHFSKFFIYQEENSYVEDGVLKLRAEKKSVDGRQYTSGQVESFGNWAQQYGYFEARVKLPTTRGFWPAFWLMPDRFVDGPSDQKSIWIRQSTQWGGMEFDIMEHLCEWGSGRNNVAVHWDGYRDDHKSWGTNQVFFGPTPDGWHYFGMLWEPGKLTWFIDGVKKAEWVNERVGSVPAYMKLSLQLGGWATQDIDMDNIQQTYDIDSVRVWQKQEYIDTPPEQTPLPTDRQAHIDQASKEIERNSNSE
ncbi:family 16 glycosylhydrolase [Coraliomargarita parva]|uniref:family 16 glycosylhydrolase n=1 Tax=Coraliomargarita parva TaxID=3014050 RepID=UPI0022B37EA1|nr:family 16 glycosylhydrolase [Coraliomargarita parva]